MLKIVGTLVVSAVLGVGIGQLQAALIYRGFEERFLGARMTLAEERGEMTAQEVEQSSDQGVPKVEVVGGTDFDFGSIMHGQTMSHDFTFRNVGTGPLNLNMGPSTCKCTVGDVETSVIQPNEEAQVKLTWTAQTVMPKFGQSATIYTNDPNSSEIQLRVRGLVSDSFMVEPRALDLGDVSVSKKIKRTLHIFTYSEDSDTLEDFLWSNPKTGKLVQIRFEKVPVDVEKFPQHRNARHAHRVDLEIQPGMPIGPMSARIQFATDLGEDAGLLDILVTGRVTGDLMLVGGTSFDPNLNLVSLGTVDASQGATVSIWLTARGEQRDQLKPTIETEIPASALNVSVGEPKMRGERKMFPIRFEVPIGASEVYYPGNSGKSFGKVLVKTGLEKGTDLPIYVRLIVDN